MIVDTVYGSLIEYLNGKAILVQPQLQHCEKIVYKNIDEESVKKQLDLICNFHSSVTDLGSYIIKRLENKTGKTVEEYKVNIRKLKRQIKNIELKSPNNEFEELLLKRGNEFINRAQKCIDEINKCNYIDLITRSMERAEVCIGNVDFRNLTYSNQMIIKSVEDCSINMVEMDCYNLLSKLRRKGAELNWENLITYFCRRELLNEDSEKFIFVLLSYPYEFMKCSTRYRENKKSWELEKYKKSLDKAIAKDGLSLI